MSEPPDFEQLARDCLAVGDQDDALERIEAIIRHAWNFRGAADIAAVDETFGRVWTTMKTTTPDDLKQRSSVSATSRGVCDAIRTLDR